MIASASSPNLNYCPDCKDWLPVHLMITPSIERAISASKSPQKPRLILPQSITAQPQQQPQPEPQNSVLAGIVPLRPDLEDDFWSRFNCWQFVQADLPKAGEKPNWKTVKAYPIAQRLANRGKLIAIRPQTLTNFHVVDVDIKSRYHPHQNPHALIRLQHALAERLGLTDAIVIRSSDSGGLHLWYWFAEPQNSYQLAAAVGVVLRDAGFVFQSGHLEIFPNCKLFIDSDNPENWVQYHPIRLPLQEPGSYLLDPHDDYKPLCHPYADQRQHFLQLVDRCQRRNELTSDRIQAVLDTQPKHFKKLSVSGNQYLNDLLIKVQFGWTEHGQTNQLFFDVVRLLRIFGHLLLNTAPFWETDRLAATILDYIMTLPGREQFCRHNHELAKIAIEWARWVQTSKYKPYGYGRKTLTEPQQTSLPELTYNQQQRQDARDRIEKAIAQLREQDSFPTTTSARIAALEALGIKRGSLYRHRDLWHPESLLDRPKVLSSQEFAPTAPLAHTEKGLKPSQEEEFAPIAHKELESLFSAVVIVPQSPSTPAADPSTLPCPSESTVLPSELPIDLSAVLIQIDVERSRLLWNAEDLKVYIADHCNGRCQSQLDDNELLWLLKTLRQLE